MADVELLPLPSEVRLAIRAYARANVEHHTAAQAAENERLRAEAELWRHKAAVHQYRRNSLAEALRMMVEMVEMSGFGKDAAMETARAALAQEDRNG